MQNNTEFAITHSRKEKTVQKCLLSHHSCKPEVLASVVSCSYFPRFAFLVFKKFLWEEKKNEKNFAYFLLRDRRKHQRTEQGVSKGSAAPGVEIPAVGAGCLPGV